MTLLLIVVSIFTGFVAGHATCLWQFRRRGERQPLHRLYGPTMSRQNPSFARMRRAF